MEGISRKKYTVFSLILTALGAMSLLLPPGSLLKLLLGCAYAVLAAALFGARFLPSVRGAARVLLGGIVFMGSVMIAGSAVYYAANLGLAAVGAVVIGMPFLPLLLPMPKPRNEALFNNRDSIGDGKEIALRRPLLTRIAGFVMLAAYAGALWYALTLVARSATDLAIRTPWDMVPGIVFALIFMAALGLFTLANSRAVGRIALLPMMLLMATAVGVTLLVYTVGYGFDPFIHRATEMAIFRDGSIMPKPFYYVGQYALVVIAAHLTGLDVGAIDLALVPIFSLLLLPVAFWSLRRAFRWDVPLALAASFGVFLLPLSSFIVTTPQGLGNTMLLMVSFLALASVCSRAFPKPLLVLLGIATALVHPLAGIPTLLFIAVLLVVSAIEARNGLAQAAKRTALIVLTIAGSVALPVIFMVNAAVSDAAVTFDTDSLKSPVTLISDLRTTPDIATRQFKAMLDIVYAWRSSRTPILLLAGLVGILLLRRKRDAAEVYAISAIIVLANYVLLKSFIDFPFLIAYEQSNYADRLLDLTVFLLAPAAIVAFGHALQRMRAGMPSLRVGMALLVATLVTASVYLAYPRLDTYESSRGWSTSANDVAAVQRIDEEAGGKPYVVLANQSVSAAAIQEFGFRQYFPGDIFFYPVPTGGPLYEQFLAMNACAGCEETAQAAMDLAGADQVFYVVNHYWFGASGMIAGARGVADDAWVINNRIWIFRYERSAR